MIAHIWKVDGGWLLELAVGVAPACTVIGTARFSTRRAAKQAALLAGAHPWNY